MINEIPRTCFDEGFFCDFDYDLEATTCRFCGRKLSDVPK